MFKLNYYCHVILNNKYQIQIYLFIYVMLYITSKSTYFAFCMSEEEAFRLSDISIEIEEEEPRQFEYIEYPITVEAKQELRQQSPILKEIESYAASQEQLLKRIDEQAELHAAQIREIDNFIRELLRRNSDLSLELESRRQEHICFIEERDNMIKKAYDDAYKSFLASFKKRES